VKILCKVNGVGDCFADKIPLAESGNCEDVTIKIVYKLINENAFDVKIKNPELHFDGENIDAKINGKTISKNSFVSETFETVVNTCRQKKYLASAALKIKHKGTKRVVSCESAGVVRIA